jgi:hypothetical protein
VYDKYQHGFLPVIDLGHIFSCLCLFGKIQSPLTIFEHSREVLKFEVASRNVAVECKEQGVEPVMVRAEE